MSSLNRQSLGEEIANAVSHGIGHCWLFLVLLF